MAEPVRPPPIVRVVRPFASERDFVDGDYASIGRNSIVLLQAASRATGELIRFEVALSNGTPVFRGEGQVIAYHPGGGNRPAGLEVRCTRLDARSKAILDQVRERRAVGTRTAPISVSNRPSPPAPLSIRPVTLVVPSVPPSPLTPQTVREALAAEPMAERSGIHLSPARAKIAPPPNRDEILGRLRERARQLAARGALPVKRTTKHTA